MYKNDQTKDNLVEMRASKKIKVEFDLMHLATFWCAQPEMFPQLAKCALKILVVFATAYLCGTGFSTLLSIKTKPRNRLDPGDDICVAITKKGTTFQVGHSKNTTKKPLAMNISMCNFIFHCEQYYDK